MRDGTQKELIKVHKETRGKLDVITFNKNGRRISSYCRLALLGAIEEIAKHNNIDPSRTCLIVDSETAPCAANNIEAYAPFIYKF